MCLTDHVAMPLAAEHLEAHPTLMSLTGGLQGAALRWAARGHPLHPLALATQDDTQDNTPRATALSPKGRTRGGGTRDSVHSPWPSSAE